MSQSKQLFSCTAIAVAAAAAVLIGLSAGPVHAGDFDSRGGNLGANFAIQQPKYSEAHFSLIPKADEPPISITGNVSIIEDQQNGEQYLMFSFPNQAPIIVHRAGSHKGMPSMLHEWCVDREAWYCYPF